MRFFSLFLLSAVLFAPFAAAQSLSTLYARNNGGSFGGAVYFDVTVANAGGIIVTSLDTNTSETVPGSLTVYVAPTTSVGNETNIGAWTQVATGTFTGQGANNPTPTDIDDFALAAGSYGFAIVMGSTTGHDYTNGNGANQIYSNADLTITAGTATTVPFTGSVFSPRIWNGTLYYSGAGNGEESYGYYGAGCPGSTGLVPVLTAPPPVINAGWVITLSDLAPNSSPFVLFGVSKSKMANGLPLPFDLSVIGAGVGCAALCDPTIAAPLAPPSAGVSAMKLAIPPLKSLLDTQIFNQGIILDPGLKGLPLCTSNGGEGIFGN